MFFKSNEEKRTNKKNTYIYYGKKIFHIENIQHHRSVIMIIKIIFEIVFKNKK